MPMLYREAPLNSIWEGSGNVICLDVLRTLRRDPGARDALMAELDTARGQHPDYDADLDATLARWPDLPAEAEARWFVERLATLLAAAVLLTGDTGPTAEAYVTTRVAGQGGRTTGAWPAALDRASILRRAAPMVLS